jgi:hypothetical protein
VFPGGEIALEEVELKACGEEAGGHQDTGAQGVVPGEDAGPTAPGDANDAAVALLVHQMDQIGRVV